MIPETLKALFNRELNKLRREISLYQDEKKLWSIEKNIPNSGGNLCLHLVGNLNTYIGAELGKSGYIRNRDLEFSQKDIPRSQLLEKIDQTVMAVDSALDKITAAELEDEYPLLVWETKTTTAFLLISMLSHLSYHLGQINYHRRLLDA